MYVFTYVHTYMPQSRTLPSLNTTLYIFGSNIVQFLQCVVLQCGYAALAHSLTFALVWNFCAHAANTEEPLY